jgi:fibronectin type 3 domain-containing protein
LITWQASQSSDVTAYRLYRSTTAGQLGQMLVETTIDVWSARDTNVTPGVSYYYTVTALDQAKNESTKSIMTTQPGHAAPFLTPEKTPNAE